MFGLSNFNLILEHFGASFMDISLFQYFRIAFRVEQVHFLPNVIASLDHSHFILVLTGDDGDEIFI